MADNKKIIIVGVPGVGKTTVISRLVHELQEKGSNVKHVVFGTIMLNEALKKYGIRHRDQLRKLPVVDQRKLQLRAAITIARMKASVLIVDTHLFINTKEGYWPGLPFDVLDALSPTNVVLLEASPREILERRMRDRSRYRDSLDESQVSRELELARNFLATSAVLTGAPLLTVINPEGNADKAVEEIAKSLGFS